MDVEAINAILKRESFAMIVLVSNKGPAKSTVQTVFLSYLKQHRLSQVNGEGFIFLIFFVINDLYLQDLPVVGKERK